MDLNLLNTIAKYLARFLTVILVLSIHEFFHAFAAVKNGDLTPKFAGRYTLNPMKHFDPFGLVLFVLAGFGWAKPVPINPSNFRNYKKGLVWTSIAGVLANFVMAFIGYAFVLLYGLVPVPNVAEANALIVLLYQVGFYVVQFFYVFNLAFCVFNLIPLYPLDGFRLWDALDRKRGKVFQFVRSYGYYILMGLIIVHFFADRIYLLSLIDILGYLMTFAETLLGLPITLFWNFIFGFIYG